MDAIWIKMKQDFELWHYINDKKKILGSVSHHPNNKAWWFCGDKFGQVETIEEAKQIVQTK